MVLYFDAFSWAKTELQNSALLDTESVVQTPKTLIVDY